MPQTRAIWITRNPTTLRHLRGLITGLEQADAVDLLQVEIMVVDDGHAVEVPREFHGGGIITADNLPPQGLLLLPQHNG